MDEGHVRFPTHFMAAQMLEELDFIDRPVFDEDQGQIALTHTFGFERDIDILIQLKRLVMDQCAENQTQLFHAFIMSTKLGDPVHESRQGAPWGHELICERKRKR